VVVRWNCRSSVEVCCCYEDDGARWASDTWVGYGVSPLIERWRSRNSGGRACLSVPPSPIFFNGFSHTAAHTLRFDKMLKAPHFNWFGRGFKLRCAITIACQLAFVLFGYDQGVFSGIVGNEDFLATFDHPSPGLEGIIVSIYNLGCFSGCILSFIFCEKTGRRLAMWIAMVWIIVR
jgi:MFS family permease